MSNQLRQAPPQLHKGATWYHGELSKDEAESLVSENGDFLLRLERNSPNVHVPNERYVITACWNGRKLHVSVRSRRDEPSHPPVFYLDDGMRVVRTPAFGNVFALVDFVRNERIKICAESDALLLRPIPVRNPSVTESEDKHDDTSEVERRPKLDRGRVTTSARRVPIRNVPLWLIEQQLSDYSQLENVMRTADKSPATGFQVMPAAIQANMKLHSNLTLKNAQLLKQQDSRLKKILSPASTEANTLDRTQRERSKSADKLLDTNGNSTTTGSGEMQVEPTTIGIESQFARILDVPEQRLATAKPLDALLLGQLRTLFAENVNVELLFDAFSRTLTTLVRDCFASNAPLEPDSATLTMPIDVAPALRVLVYAETIRYLFTALLVFDEDVANTQSSYDGAARAKAIQRSQKDAVVAKLVELVCLAVRKRVQNPTGTHGKAENSSLWSPNQLLFVCCASVLYDAALSRTVMRYLESGEHESPVVRYSAAAPDRRVTERLRTFFLNDARAHFDAAMQLHCLDDRLPNIVPYLLVNLLNYSDAGKPQQEVTDAALDAETRSRLALIQSWCQLDEFVPLADDLGGLLASSLDQLFVYELVLSKSRTLVSAARTQQTVDSSHASCSHTQGWLPSTSSESVLAHPSCLLLALFGTSVQTEIRHRCLLRRSDARDVRFWFDASIRMNKILSALKSRLARC